MTFTCHEILFFPWFFPTIEKWKKKSLLVSELFKNRWWKKNKQKQAVTWICSMGQSLPRAVPVCIFWPGVIINNFVFQIQKCSGTDNKLYGRSSCGENVWGQRTNRACDMPSFIAEGHYEKHFPYKCQYISIIECVTWPTPCTFESIIE